MRKTAIIVMLAVVVLVAILIPILKSCETALDLDQHESIRDSLNYYGDLEQLHKDSAKIYHEKFADAFEKYTNLRPGTPGWDSTVAAYTARIRAEIQRGDSGLSSPVRVNKTGIRAPADSL